jgi:DNA-binding response OmpR family regulator
MGGHGLPEGQGRTDSGDHRRAGLTPSEALIEMPVRKPAAVNSAASQFGAAIMTATMRLLVVEDEVRLAAGLRKGLEAEGFAVDVVHTGTDGIWMARENPFDAIVLDIMLPGVNGYQVCRTLRDDGNWTPILLLTAKDRTADEVEGLETGADDYLTKPFSYAVLIARLRALLRRGARPRPTVVELDDLRLDPAARRVWLRGDEIHFTAREFAVLEFFVGHPDEVLSKKDILDHVWDFDFDGDPNIVEVYIRRLRAKLQFSADLPVIETIRGAGYRLVVGRA